MGGGSSGRSGLRAKLSWYRGRHYKACPSLATTALVEERLFCRPLHVHLIRPCTNIIYSCGDIASAFVFSSHLLLLVTGLSTRSFLSINRVFYTVSFHKSIYSSIFVLIMEYLKIMCFITNYEIDLCCKIK